MSLSLKATKRFVRQHWLTVSFIFGFLNDFILLNKVDDLFDNIILFTYATLATISFLFLYVGVAEKGPRFLVSRLKKYAPLVMQYAFGGLLSGMLIFYGRSGDLWQSAPFILLIIFVILGNEFIAKRSDRMLFQLALYFIGIFSYIVLIVPVLIGYMGDVVFILSGLLALMMVTFVVQTLYKIVPHFMALNTQRVIVTIGAIYITFNTFYFLNIIPPIPLSLTTLEFTHSAILLDDGYHVVIETQPWYRHIPLVRPVIHPSDGALVCFARVFAPTNLETEIFHRWEYKDAVGEWREHFRLGYAISGVRDDGYGGYTQVQNFTPGVWRCTVETRRGQILGRTEVLVEDEGEPKKIVQEVW